MTMSRCTRCGRIVNVHEHLRHVRRHACVLKTWSGDSSRTRRAVKRSQQLKMCRELKESSR